MMLVRTDPGEGAVVDLCRELVAVPSPTGDEGALAEVLVNRMRDLGYDVAVDALGNVVGCIDGGSPGPRVLLDAHLDTVEVADPGAWTVDPFGAREMGGRIYGRGSSDMKGALAAMVWAAARFAGGRDEFPGQVWVSATVAEETFEGVAARAVGEKVDPDLVIVGESTGLRVNRGGRGRAEISLTTRGRSAHSSNPSEGKNAVYAMTEAIGHLRGMRAHEHPELGRGILELTDIISSPYPGASVVPDRCTATYDRRLLPGEDAEGVINELTREIAHLGDARVAMVWAEMKTWTGHTLSAERFFPAWIYPIDDPDLIRVTVALEGRGLYRGTGTYSFCTNAAHWAGSAGVPTIGYGPSREEIAHIPDEYLEIEELVEAASGYHAILEGLMQ